MIDSLRTFLSPAKAPKPGRAKRPVGRLPVGRLLAGRLEHSHSKCHAVSQSIPWRPLRFSLRPLRSSLDHAICEIAIKHEPIKRSPALLASIVLLIGAPGLHSERASPLTTHAASHHESHSDDTARDGKNDFDFDLGVWHTHIRRVLDPFSDSANAIELNGTVTVRKIWDGRAQLEEIEADGPKGHWEGMTLFLYNPQSRQWSMNFINSKIATLNAPLTGAFKDGRGELFSLSRQIHPGARSVVRHRAGFASL
jgi:hypothetical protein